jgi:hypothetical protein
MKNPLTKIVLLVLLIFIVVNNIVFVPHNILSWDVFGYYLYLPLKFIYHDLSVNDFSTIETIIAKYHNTGTFYQGIHVQGTHWVMKYSMGLSIFYCPFFFIGHIAALFSNYPADGFSYPYQMAVFAGCIIYSIIGMIVLSKVLLRFLPDRVVAITMLIIVFSTNYVLHCTMYGQNALAHNILFTTYTLILWFTIRWHETKRTKHIVFLAIVCGLTILSRPSDIVCLLIPAFWGVTNKESFIARYRLLKEKKKQFFIFLSILLGIGLIQCIYWQVVTGSFLFYSYKGNAGEGFEFLTPYFSKVLFSFRKGWLVYTPVMIFAIIGFVMLYKRNKYIFFGLFTYFIFNLYVVSSWSCWWYAQSYGQRALIQSYPIMAISLGYFLLWLGEQKIIVKFLLSAVIVLFTGLNIFQTTQMHKGVLSDDRMTKEYYFAVFGKMKVPENADKLLLINRSFSNKDEFTNENHYSPKLLTTLDFENRQYGDSTQVFTGHYSFKLDTTTKYSPAIEAPYYKLTDKDHAWIRITAYVYPLTDASHNAFSLVAHFVNRRAYHYYSLDSEKLRLKPGEWNKITFDYLTPEVRKRKDLLKVYFWFRGKEPIYVDNLQVKVYEEKGEL